MTSPADLLDAARRIVESARRDLARGWADSACISAHRGAVLATQAWLEREGQTHVANSVRENVGFSPAADGDVRAAAELLDRHRVEEGSAHRSFHGATDAPAEAPAVVATADRVLAFVETRLA